MAERTFRERVAEAMRRELVRSEMTEQELAAKLGIERTTLKRMLLGYDRLNFEQVDRVMAAMGARIDPVGRRPKSQVEKEEYVPIIEQVRQALKDALAIRAILKKDLAERTGVQASTVSDITRGTYGFSASLGDTLLQGLNARVKVELILDDDE